jgi:hypothetical protein
LINTIDQETPMMFKYQVDLYSPQGNAILHWTFDTKFACKLVDSSNGGTLKVTDINHDTVFVAAVGWQIVLTEITRR